MGSNPLNIVGNFFHCTVCKASLLDVRNNYYKMQENNLAAPLCSLTSLAGGEGLAVPPKEPNPIFGPLSQA